MTDDLRDLLFCATHGYYVSLTALQLISGDEGTPCGCGSPPYTDGRPCPRHYALLVLDSLPKLEKSPKEEVAAALRQARQDEREACAQAAEALFADYRELLPACWASREVAWEIRARGEKP